MSLRALLGENNYCTSNKTPSTTGLVSGEQDLEAANTGPPELGFAANSYLAVVHSCVLKAGS
jgi:hypothetical protein